MKKVIIVGASSGIGRELAILYARSNCMVGITGRRKNLLEELQFQFPDKIVLQSLDNTKDDVEEIISELISRLGGLDLLILSSGTGIINSSLDWQIEKETIDLNVTAWTRIAIFTFKYFKEQNHGHFAAITSVAAIRGEGRVPGYNASKAFQAHYLEGLRKNAVYRKLKISITDIQPGFVKTSMGKDYKRFWESSAEKAARQIFIAIKKKRKKVYITKRWWLAAMVLKILPGYIYNRL